MASQQRLGGYLTPNGTVLIIKVLIQPKVRVIPRQSLSRLQTGGVFSYEELLPH